MGKRGGIGGMGWVQVLNCGILKFVKNGGGRASFISYFQNRHSQGRGLHPYHIFIIGVVNGGGVS